MFGFTSLVPFLLASAPSPTRQLLKDVNNLYGNLKDSTVFKHYSPTIKFSFVSPPDSDTSSWENSQKESTFSGENFTFSHLSSAHGDSKPIALYLPGLDGLGISATRQFDDLASNFEFWRMSVLESDRSSFAELKLAVSSFIEEVAIEQNRDIIVIGESFGGLLAPGVALRVKNMVERKGVENPIKGLVMVNPATSFYDTDWSTLGPFLASLRHLEDENGDGNLPTPYSVVGGLSLAQRIPDNKQFNQILSMLTSTEIRNADDINDLMGSMVDGFGVLATELPAATIEHRVSQWLPVGSTVVNPRLPSLDVPTLIVAGREDNMLPSRQEAERLVSIMPNAKKLDVRGSGHFVLDDRVNLTEAIIYSDIDPFDKMKAKPKDPILDWALPPPEEIKEIVESRVKPLRRLTSPIFFSTSKQGSRRRGLSHLPKPSDGPLLFVANHQFGGLDLGMILAQLIEDRGIAARGLAHPVVMQGQSGANAPPMGQPSQPGIRETNDNNFFSTDLFNKFGAVMVTPRNYYRLMQTGQTALLFPGGVREVFHGRDEAYKLFWPENDFVRTAARFNATIVPLSAVGAADSVNILLSPQEMAKLPFGIGDNILASSANITSARFDSDDTDELFATPFALPKGLPERHYFMFGKPFSTKDVDYRDPEACAELFQNVKKETERGFDDILRARKKDPFANSVQRLAYEQLWGKQAPTFSIDELS